ncbi:MAG: histidinol dehydrogenase [Candidatus Hodgkinia cicadicola]
MRSSTTGGGEAIYVSTSSEEVFDLQPFHACAVPCGIKAVYHMGCAQAVAVMAAGTRRVAKVDRSSVWADTSQVCGTSGCLGRPHRIHFDRTERIIIADWCASAAAIGAEVILHVSQVKEPCAPSSLAAYALGTKLRRTLALWCVSPPGWHRNH